MEISRKFDSTRARTVGLALLAVLALFLAAGFAFPGQASAKSSQGWKVRGGKLCYVTEDGGKARSTTVDGIKLAKNGYAKVNTASRLKLACMRRVNRITKKSWSKQRKLKACFSYALTRPFVNSNEPRDIGTSGWVQRCALRALRTERTECFGCACSFAMLAYELGYKPTVYGYPKDHAYVIIDGKRWDNMASQPKVIGVKHWKVLSWSELDPRGSKTSVFLNGQKYEPYKGLTKLKGAWYYYKDGKRLKRTWKKVGGRTYYFKSDGKAATGPCKVRRSKNSEKAWWVFSSKGVLQNGRGTRVVKIGKARYRVTKSGRAKAGWARAHSRLYLKNGMLATGTRLVKGKLCSFGRDGLYDSEKSSELQACSNVGGPATDLVALLGKAKKTKTHKNTCWELPGNPQLKGVDRTRWYRNLIVSTFLAEDGVEYLESVVSA